MTRNKNKTKQLLELITSYGKVVGYKVNTGRLMVSCTPKMSNWNLKFKKILFSLSPKKKERKKHKTNKICIGSI